MKMKHRKLYRVLSMVLCCIMLLGLAPTYALGDDGTVAAAATVKRYQAITSINELKVGSQYVFTYKDAATGIRYALSTDAASGYTVATSQLDDYTLMIDPSGDEVFSVYSVGGDGTYKFQASNGSFIKLNSAGIFDSSQGNITLKYDDASGYWSIGNAGGRAMTVIGGKFSIASNANAAFEFEIWTLAPTKYVKLVSLEQLGSFQSDSTQFIMTVETAKGIYAMGNTNASNETDIPNWLHAVSLKTDNDGNDYIGAEDTAPYIFQVKYDNSKYENGETCFQTGSLNGVKNWAFNYIVKTEDVVNDKGEIESKNTYASGGIYLKNGGGYFYPQNLGDGAGSPYRNSGNNNTVRFEYGTGANDSDKIYIRGNAQASYLGIDADGKYTGKATQNDPNRVAIEIFVAIEDDSMRIEYMKPDSNEVQRVAYADAKGGIVLNNQEDRINYNGYTYRRIGWTMKKPATSFLTLEQSCNIFDYDKDYLPEMNSKGKMEGKGHLIEGEGTVKDTYEIIGDGNPELSTAKITAVEIDAAKAAGKTAIQLYPIYAVRGFDTVVTGDDKTTDGTTPIIGLSDWKEDQGGTAYKNSEKENWLGTAKVTIYKDGDVWVNSETLYFSYHNDMAVDLNIKFIWNNKMQEPQYQKGDNDQLYWYMADRSNFPDYDQSGHYIVDAVIADQGTSELGLQYRYNWMTNHGGQLDNVAGGQTVKVYVTTKYDVKYYLDDKLITDPAWASTGFYTTDGTEKKYAADCIEAGHNVEFDVTMDNERKDLMNGTNVGTDKEDAFVSDTMKERGGYNVFSYFVKDYEHTIPIAKSPAELVPAGNTLTSKAWTLKDQNKKEQGTIAWSSNYTLTGNSHGTGNTAASYTDTENVNMVAADRPYTFHLYAYTEGPKTGDNTDISVWMFLVLISFFTISHSFLFSRKGYESKRKK